MIVTSLGSLLILLAILFVVFLIVRNNSRNRNNLSVNKIWWLLGGYFAILLISTVLYAVISANHPVSKPTDGKTGIEEKYEFIQKAINGKVDKIDPSLIKKKWQFHVSGKKFTIVGGNDNLIDTTVVVKRKPENDGEIEATLYRTDTRVGVNDINKEILPSKVEWSGDILIFKHPKTKLRFAVASHAFTVSQFKGGTWSHSTVTLGTELLYLKIPHDLKIVGPEVPSITYVQQ